MAYDGNYIDDLDEGRPDGKVEFGNIVDDAIREIKRAVKNCFKAEHHGDSSGAHKFPFGDTLSRPTGVQGRIYLNTEKNTIEYYDGTEWKYIGDFPSGTKLIFPMDTPPVGWTKITDWNDVTIIITSGSDGGTTGGDWHINGLSTSSAGSHQHGAAGEHYHWLPIYRAQNDSRCLAVTGAHYRTISDGAVGAFGFETTSRYQVGTYDAGSHQHPAAGAHTHSLSHDGSWRPAHLKVICAERD